MLVPFTQRFEKSDGRSAKAVLDYHEDDTLYRYLISHGTGLLLLTTGNIEGNHNIAFRFALAIIQM